MLAPMRKGDTRSREAVTGAPAHASTVFNPTARSSVLFPLMLEPLTIHSGV